MRGGGRDRAAVSQTAGQVLTRSRLLGGADYSPPHREVNVANTPITLGKMVLDGALYPPWTQGSTGSHLAALPPWQAHPASP